MRSRTGTITAADRTANVRVEIQEATGVAIGLRGWRGTAVPVEPEDRAALGAIALGNDRIWLKLSDGHEGEILMRDYTSDGETEKFAFTGTGELKRPAR